MNRATVILLLAILVASLTSHALGGNGGRPSPNPNRKDGASSNDIVPGVVVVKFKHTSSVSGGQAASGPALLQNAFSERGVTSLARAFPSAIGLNAADIAAGKIDLSQIHFAAIPPDLDPRDVASQLAQLPQVEYAEPKYYSYLCDVPNDSDYSATQQVYFDRMNVAAGWALQKGSSSVVIATVDGGTNWQHPDLLPNIWVNPGEDLNHNGIFDRFPFPAGDINSADDDDNGFADDVVGWNFTNQTKDPRGFKPGNANHGTETASVFGAVTNNGQGMAGTSWNCRIMPVCVADPNSDNSILDGFKGIAYAAANGARVINCSWGRPGGTGNYSQYEQDVITAAWQKGALIVAAVDDHHQHTDFDNTPFYPAAYKHVLSVGATTDTSDELAYFSQYGMGISVFAPGMHIRVALDNGTYGTAQGTSFSSPLVAGLAGLLVAAHPDWSPDQIAEQIRITADPIDASNPNYAGSLGRGRVNFGRALSEIHSGVIIVDARFNTPSGRPFFFEGDTLILSLKLKNILPAPALNLSFDVVADSALLPLGTAHAPASLGPGAVDSVDFAFRVGNLTQTREAFIRPRWSANANDWDAGAFKKTLYATSGFWQTQTSPTSTPFYSIHAVNKKVVWAAASTSWDHGALIFRTTDEGLSWNVAGNLPTVGAMCIFAIDSLHAWVGTSLGQIYATTSGGASWAHQVYSNPQSSYIDGIWFFDANNGYALGDPDPGTPGKFVFLQTSDGGITWSHNANEPVGDPGAFGITNTLCWTDWNHGWFGGNGGLLWRTTNAGASWSSASIGTSTDYTSALAMQDESVGIAGEGAMPARTVDGGVSWQTQPGTRAEWIGGAAFPAGSTSAWVCGGSSVDFSSDGGASWLLQPTFPVSGSLVAISFSDPTNGWIATDKGEILRYQNLTPTTGLLVKSTPETPAGYLLNQNYPNPFNPTTMISYQLPVASNVRLVMFDILGREVSVLVNERKPAGSYSLRFDGHGMASGVYFYQLMAGTFIETKKLLLLR